ncbi:DNA-binding transcriptional MerR regulator [Planomicrobium sp. HSC-17F08]|nr:DNA-binding transcriptional MerR regulator [Planomicrobium sp. HSC-17F08]
MENMDRLIENLGVKSGVLLEDIPKIDLYIDQVIQLFETSFADAKRNEEEKILTKTMINNYAKGKLFYPVHNKKYTRNHIMLISLIYQMKSALSINDVKQVLDGLNERAMQQNLNLESFYESYLELQQGNIGSFAAELNEQAGRVSQQAAGMEDAEELEQVLLIASLVHTSNLYRKAAEKLVDDMKERGKAK